MAGARRGETRGSPQLLGPTALLLYIFGRLPGQSQLATAKRWRHGFWQPPGPWPLFSSASWSLSLQRRPKPQPGGQVPRGYNAQGHMSWAQIQLQGHQINSFRAEKAGLYLKVLETCWTNAPSRSNLYKVIPEWEAAKQTIPDAYLPYDQTLNWTKKLYTTKVITHKLVLTWCHTQPCVQSPLEFYKGESRHRIRN